MQLNKHPIIKRAINTLRKHCHRKKLVNYNFHKKCISNAFGCIHPRFRGLKACVIKK